MQNFTGNKLREELHEYQKRRHDYSTKKLAFATTFLGVGAIKTVGTGDGLEIDFSLVLYIIPLVAIAYDLFILAEEHRIMRIGAFILSGRGNSSLEEIEWEKFAKDFRNFYSVLAVGFVTVIYFLGSAFIIFQKEPIVPVFNLWMILVTITIVLMYLGAYITRKRVDSQVNGSID